jgi:ankyrin repeat protein
MPLFLSTLPPEILLQILKQHHILSEPDLYSLVQVNHKLGSLAKEYLYKSNARQSHSSALSWAAETGALGTAQLALRYGADINVRSRLHGGATPLFLAARNNHAGIVRWFLTKGGTVDVNSRSNMYHETALSIASQMGHVEVVEILLGHESVRSDLADTSGQTPLFWACCNNHPAIVKALVRRGNVDVNRQRKEDGATPLMAATASGYVDVVEALLSSSKPERFNPNVCKSNDGTTALMLAAIKRHAGIFDLLLDTFPTINLAAQDDHGMTTLLHAVSAGAESIVHKLIERGVNVNHQNADGVTPLALASNHGFEHIVRLLLSHKTDAMLLDKRGWSPLHWAAQSGHSGVVKLLLNNDSPGGTVDPGLRSFVGTTPLHCASWDGHYDIIRLLVSRKDVDINCEDNAGWTPLMWAASNNKTEILRLLLADPRVHVNTRNHAGMTALCFAAKKGHGMAVEMLVSYPGIDLVVKDKNGKTAQMYALENGYGDIADILGSEIRRDVTT